MHDKYAYERIEMALHDRDVERTMACGIAGLAVAADSLSAVKYARGKVIREAAGLVERFIQKIRRYPTYRGARHTQSVLTITSNVVYGHKTGTTPDGRRAG